MKRFASILVIVVLMFGLVGCGGNETPQKVEDRTEQSSTETLKEETESKEEESVQEAFEIGDVIQIGNVIATVNSVRESDGNTVFKPDEGNTYYIVDMTIENKGSEAYNSSTMLQMSIVDGEAYKYDIAIGPELKGSLDGKP